MPTLELNGKPFAEQTGTGEPVLKGNLNFEGPIRINNQEVLSANGSIRLTVDEISEKTQGGGITLSHSLKNSSGAEIINSSGSIGSAVDFTNIANNAISGDKIYGGTISTSAAVFESSSANAIVRITQTGTGNALVVEDSANPDSTPFVVDASGKVGIGTDSPNSLCEIRGSSNGQNVLHLSNSAGTSNGGAENQIRVTCNGNTNWGDLDIQAYRTIFTQNNEERMRIDSSGNVGLTGGGTLSFYSGASVVGSIVPSSIGTTYNTTSDLRLKDNIQPISDGTEKLMAMNPVSHTWKADPEAPSVHGFIAQEMVNIIPEAVSGTSDGEEMMTMDYGRITPVLVAALQDAHKKIKELENRLNTLESN